jgi:hypothetical protein
MAQVTATAAAESGAWTGPGAVSRGASGGSNRLPVPVGWGGRVCVARPP